MIIYSTVDVSFFQGQRTWFSFFSLQIAIFRNYGRRRRRFRQGFHVVSSRAAPHHQLVLFSRRRFSFFQRNDAFITQFAIEGDRPILFNLECDIINKKKGKLIIAPAG